MKIVPDAPCPFNLAAAVAVVATAAGGSFVFICAINEASVGASTVIFGEN